MKALRNLYILQILLILGMLTTQGIFNVVDQVLLAITILILFSVFVVAARYEEE